MFRIKKFEEGNLGNYLREGREKLNLSRNEIAELISVSPRHLRALEENDLSKLPPEIYVRGFIARYCDAVELDKAEALRFFEKKKLTPKCDNPIRSIIAHAWFGKIFSYRNLAISVAILFLVTSVFYISKAIYPMYARPSFVLINPNTCPYETSQEKLELNGIIQPESKIWINDEESLVNKEGNFNCPLFLKNGENFVRFRILNKFGKERSEECVIMKN